MSEISGHKDRNTSSIVIWTTIALLGAAALTYVVARRLARGQNPLDADALLDAADKAANQLDAILLAENQLAS